MIDRNEAHDIRGFACADAVLLDIETSGLNENRDRVISVSADKITGGKTLERFFSFVAFEGNLPPEVVELTGIRDEMLAEAPDLDTVMKNFEAFCGNLLIYADCAPFVRRFLKNYDLEIRKWEGKPISPRFFDSLIDGSEDEDPLVAFCKADLRHFRETYSFCEWKIARAEEAGELSAKINEVAADPYEAFLILLRIPQNALEETARRMDVRGKMALIGAVKSDIFDAVIGCCKRKP